MADGLGSPFAGEWTLAMTQRYVDGIALIDDATILAGMRFALERMKQLVEPAGAAALAAVLRPRAHPRWRAGLRGLQRRKRGSGATWRVAGGRGATRGAGGGVGRQRRRAAIVRAHLPSVHAEVVQPVVVDAQVVGQLVDDRDPDLVLQFGRIGEILQQGGLEERDLVRQEGPVGGVFRSRHALVQPVEPIARSQPGLAALPRGRLARR